jgi:stage III sporulation protein AH
MSIAKKLTQIADTSNKESAIETIIKAKGFKEALVIISDESVTVIVPVESLLPSETLQIQDAVTSQIDTELEKIKIITVK